MTIIVSDSAEGKGKESAKRHKDKQREAIKKNITDIIADESIITSKRGKIVKVPIKSLQNERFRQGKRQEGDEEGEGSGRGGVGQGSGKKGDIIGQRPAQRPGDGDKAGDEPGEDYIEGEFELQDLIEMMFEDLDLPNLQERDIKELEVIFGFTIKDITKHGPRSLLHRRPTAKEGMRRFWFFLNYLKEKYKDDPGKDEKVCFMALKRAKGILEKAETLLESKTFVKRTRKGRRYSKIEVKPFPIIANDDMRYRKIEKDISHESNAVVVAVMDVSGSMSDMKKYLVRALLFWLVELLRKRYEKVEIRFIVHHTEARIVPEEDFFRTGESGGTMCWKGFELAGSLLETEYPNSAWNRYVFQFSDGEDWDMKRTTDEIKCLIESGVQMVGYGEIDLGGVRVDEDHLYGFFKKYLPVTELDYKKSDDLQVIVGDQEFPFLGVVITEKKDILPAIKQFLQKGRF